MSKRLPEQLGQRLRRAQPQRLPLPGRVAQNVQSSPGLPSHTAQGHGEPVLSRYVLFCIVFFFNRFYSQLPGVGAALLLLLSQLCITVLLYVHGRMLAYILREIQVDADSPREVFCLFILLPRTERPR